MSKKFEYELTLRLEKAEKSIASIAAKIEKDLGKAVETAFRGASEFDVVKFSKNIGSRIEQDISSALKSAFSGSSEFDFGKRIAVSIEQDLKQAVRSAFSGSSEFSLAGGGDVEKAKRAALALDANRRRSDEYTAQLEQKRLETAKQAALALDANRRRSDEYTAQLEQKRLETVRERVNLEVNAFVTSRKEAAAAVEAEQVRLREAKQRALEGAFSGGVPLDLQDKADKEAFDKRIDRIRQSSETRNQVAEQDYQRDIQRADGVAAHLAEKRKEAEAAVAQENQDMASRAAQRDKLEEAHTSRLSKNAALLKEYYATYKDPSALNAIQTVEKSLERHSESLKSSGLSLTEQKKVHDDYTKSKLDALDKLTGKEQKATADRIAQIRTTETADKAARDVRYKDHQQVLSIISQAEQQNAQQLTAIEQRITTMTKAEAKEQLDAYRKLAKARIDYAVEAGYAMEAEAQRQSAAGARGVSAVFQVQQAVEDSMYAGLRGAGNNIAFLLTSVANQWVAIGGLIGVATLQLAEHLGLFDKLNESMDGALWKTKEQVRQEEYLFRLRKEEFDRTTKQQIDSATFSPAGKTVASAQKEYDDAQKKLEIERDRESRLRVAIELFKELQAVEAPRYVSGGTNTDLYLKQLEERRIAAQKLRDQINELGISFTADGADSKMLAAELEAVKKAMEDMGSQAAATESSLKPLKEQLEKVTEAAERFKFQEEQKERSLKFIDESIEKNAEVVKLRQEELQTIQQSISAAEAALRAEERRAEAIREAASARKDEAAKQELGLKNTLLDMEANEKAKAAKEKASSAEEKIQQQLSLQKQWAEHQAKVDKFNAKPFSKLNPQINFDIDEAKAKWINNIEQQAKFKIDQIKKLEQIEIESAKKVAEQQKKINLDAMEAAQKQKVNALKAEVDQQLGQGKFGDAQSTLDKAEKALKELANAKVANLNQKDSVAQGEAALKDWQEVQKQLEQLDAKKEEVSNKAREAEKAFILQEKAREDQAAARLETAKDNQKELLGIKKQIQDVKLISDADEAAVARIVAEFQRLLDLRQQFVTAGPAMVPGPMLPPQLGPSGSSGGGGMGGGGAAPHTLPGPQFHMNFSMGSATPNAVAAAASSIVQTQKTLAMLGGN